ncbi:MAG: hypothetical protein V4726_01375 [Verrucomicrobiota bacterium]
MMKTSLKLTASALILIPALLRAQNARPANPLDSLPEPVRAAVLKAAGEGRVDEVKTTTADQKTIYLVEIDLKDDRDLDLRVAADGQILKSVEEIQLGAAPEAVRAALEKLAGATAQVDDVKKVTKDGKVTWHAELDRTGTPDTHVRLDAQGVVLEKKEEQK